jgi:uncharacterized repeat protein (TIGR01451 family)
LNQTISEYTTAGAAVNVPLVTGLTNAQGIAVSGNSLFVMNAASGARGAGTISQYPVNSESASATDSDTLTPQADLEITKSDNVGGSSVTGAVGTAVPGQGINYTIVVSNTGPSDATGASILDSLPGGLGGVTFTASETGGATGFTQSGTGSIEDADVDMPTGSTITYTVHATVNSSATGALANTATVTAPDATTVNAGLITGLEIPDAIALSGDDLFVLDFETNTIAEYTTAGVLVNPALVSGLDRPSGIAISGGNIFVTNGLEGMPGYVSEYTLSGALVNASLVTGLMAPGSIAVSDGKLFVANFIEGGSGQSPIGVIGEYDATTGAPINATLLTGVNGAIAVSGGNLFVAQGNGISEYTTAGATVDASLVTGLVDDSGFVVFGARLVVSGDRLFVIDGNTIGEYTTAGKTVNSALVAGLTNPTALAISGGNLFVTNMPIMAQSDVAGTPPADVAFIGEYSIVAHSATDTDTLAPQADLEITQTDNLGGSSATGAIGTAVPGQGITYTIVVANNGPSDATGVSVVDALPGILSGATFTATATGNATGFTQSGTGSIDDTAVSIPAGSTITYTIHATIASSATGTLSNAATLTAPAGLDTNSKTSATDTDTLTPQADLQITNTDNLGGSSATGAIGTAVPGQTITYTIVVSNTGPSDATGVSVVDALPGILSGATFTAAATGNATGFTQSGTGSIDDTAVSIPADSTITYTIHATIASSATGTLSNAATLTAPAGLDTNSKTSAIDTDTLAPQADLEITQTDNLGGSSATGAVGTAVPGLGITYTIVVANNGPSDATGVSVVDALPGILSGATFTAVTSGGASGFSQSGTGSIDDAAVNLPAGSTITYTIHAGIASSATGTLSNAATLTAPAGLDTNSKTSATDTDALTPQTDLQITNTDNLAGSSVTGATGTAVPGLGITYTIVVSNTGPSDATGATVIDTLSNLLSGATFTATETGGATGFTASGSGSIDDTAVNLPAGSTVTYTIVATIASSATGTLSNTATVTPSAGVTDSPDGTHIVNDAIGGIRLAAVTVGGNNSATDTDKLTPEANLQIVKTDNLGGSSVTGAIGSGVPGQAITYTIVVTSAGPSDAIGASLVDTLPSALIGATYTAVATGGATGFTASGTGNIDDTALNMPAGSTITYTVHATIAAAASGTLSSTTTATTPTGADHSHPGVSSATVADMLSLPPVAPPATNLGALDFTVSALLTGNLTVTGSYAPPPSPHNGLPISQTGSTSFGSMPASPFLSLAAAAVDNFMMSGGGGGDVELLGPQLDIDLTKVDQGPHPLGGMLADSRSEDWSSDELIGSVLERLADFDELSLVSFEFGDDVVSPTTRKAQRVTAAKPVVLQGSLPTSPAITRGTAATPELNVQPTGSQGNGNQGNGGGGSGGGALLNDQGAKDGSTPEGSSGDGAAGAGSPGATGPSTELAPADSAAQSGVHGWGWWLGWSVSAGSMGTLSWVYGWRRRGRRSSAYRLQKQ